MTTLRGLLANITNIGSTTVNTDGAVTFTGTFPATAFTLDGDNMVTMNNEYQWNKHCYHCFWKHN